MATAIKTKDTSVRMPENMLAAIKSSSMLAYIWGVKEAKEYVTKTELRVSTHGTVINGVLYDSIVGSKVIPAGTKGFVIAQPVFGYSKWIWIGDEQYPAADAVQTLVKVYYTFLTMVKDGEYEVLADSFQCIDK